MVLYVRVYVRDCVYKYCVRMYALNDIVLQWLSEWCLYEMNVMVLLTLSPRSTLIQSVTKQKTKKKTFCTPLVTTYNLLI